MEESFKEVEKMKIKLYWSTFSNRIFYTKGNSVYRIDGLKSSKKLTVLK